MPKGNDMVLDTIIALVAQQFQMDEDEIAEGTVFADLGAEELDIADLVMAVEDAFDTEISTDEANAIETVSDLVDLAERAVRSEE